MRALGNSSTASESSDPRGQRARAAVRQLRFLFLVYCTTVLPSLLVFFLCFCGLFHFHCFHVQVLWTTLVNEFLISCSHTEWYLATLVHDFVISCSHTEWCLKTLVHVFLISCSHTEWCLNFFEYLCMDSSCSQIALLCFFLSYCVYLRISRIVFYCIPCVSSDQRTSTVIIPALILK